MRFWYLMHQRAAKAVMNLRKCAILPDHIHSTDVFEGSDQNSDLQILSSLLAALIIMPGSWVKVQIFQNPEL